MLKLLTSPRTSHEGLVVQLVELGDETYDKHRTRNLVVCEYAEFKLGVIF